MYTNIKTQHKTSHQRNCVTPGVTLKQPALVAKQHDRMDQTGCSADEAAAYVKGAATLP